MLQIQVKDYFNKGCLNIARQKINIYPTPFTSASFRGEAIDTSLILYMNALAFIAICIPPRIRLMPPNMIRNVNAT